MTLTGHIVGTKGNTGRGIASIVENADYTITINLTDGSSYTTAPIAGFTAVEFDENYDLVVTKTDGTTETVETDIEAFRTVLAGYKSDAETAESNASGYATAASGSASTATSQATLAKSYAKGGTSSRTGEDTDNADYYRGLAATSATNAGNSETGATTQALKSEGYAVGQQNGSDVDSDSTYYHNNAKYYEGMARDKAVEANQAKRDAVSASQTSEAYAKGTVNGTDVESGSTGYHDNSKYYKEQASTSATNAGNSATAASTSAGTATAQALKAEGYAVGKQNGTDVSSGTYYENNAKYYATEAENSASAAAASAASLTVDSALDDASTNPVQNKVIKGALDTKANIDGAYEAMTVGNAEQLVSTVFVNDEDPYNFRTAGGSADIGDREYDTVVGGTVVWNQLMQNGNFADGTTGWTPDTNVSMTASDGVLSFTSSVQYGAVKSQVVFTENHKYLLAMDIKGSSNIALNKFNIYNTAGVYWKNVAITTAWQEYSSIAYFDKPSSTRNINFQDNRDSGWDTISMRNVIVIDLTQMFGSTIADYIYNLETANEGVGVAWFKKLFPKPYYSYNAGELMSVNTSAHNTVGFNAWDEEWEVGAISWTGINSPDNTRIRCKNYIPCIGGATYYYANSANAQFLYYDENKAFISYENSSKANTTFTPPINAKYMRFYLYGQAGADYGTTYKGDICINLSWDGERDGEYEEYVKHSYPLDSDLVLRGIPKLDASNNLYYDGDVYESDGSVTRKHQYLKVDGNTTLGIGGNTGGGVRYWTLSPLPIVSLNTNATNPVLLSPQFVSRTGVEVGNAYVTGDGSVLVVVVDQSIETSATAFKTWLASHPLEFILPVATPITETADPFQSPQIVDDFGTEEYVDYALSEGDRDVAIPVGHVTKYTNNLRAKLEMSPNSPDGAGDYLVRQTNGENEYVTLASNATIQNIIARLEALEGGGE